MRGPDKRWENWRKYTYREETAGATWPQRDEPGTSGSRMNVSWKNHTKDQRGEKGEMTCKEW